MSRLPWGRAGSPRRRSRRRRDRRGRCALRQENPKRTQNHARLLETTTNEGSQPLARQCLYMRLSTHIVSSAIRMDAYTQNNLNQQAQYTAMQQTTYQQAPVQYPSSGPAANPQDASAAAAAAAAAAAYQQYQQQYYQQYQQQMYAASGYYPVGAAGQPSAAATAAAYPVAGPTYPGQPVYPQTTPQAPPHSYGVASYAGQPLAQYPPYNAAAAPAPATPTVSAAPVDKRRAPRGPAASVPPSDYHPRLPSSYRSPRPNDSPRFHNRPPPPVGAPNGVYYPPPVGPDMMPDVSRYSTDGRGMPPPPMGMPPPDYHHGSPYRGGMRNGPRGMSDRGRGPSYRPDHRFAPRGFRPGPPGPHDDFRPYGPGGYDRRAGPLPPPPARNDWRPHPPGRDDFRPRGGGRGGFMDRRPPYDRERDPKRRRMEEPPPPARDAKSQTAPPPAANVTSTDPAPPGVTEPTREGIKAPPPAFPPPSIAATAASSTKATDAPTTSSTSVSSPPPSASGKVLVADYALGKLCIGSSAAIDASERISGDVDVDMQYNESNEFRVEDVVKGIPIGAFFNQHILHDPWEELERSSVEHPAGFNPY
ncbi:hypothetical protein SeLEV6574_g04628 [Synchytrium endobioticum]|uniref:Uncharacterized protein n=1 Tax=Synchytrium endobioticum TaxID=286115 RepID=A0A507CYD6_9FUNG|nr:hypothetical protein SeLEV6574_g04628 [Synchytrium endobioticum]